MDFSTWIFAFRKELEIGRWSMDVSVRFVKDPCEETNDFKIKVCDPMSKR